jgi:hypothetical protein
MDSQQCSTDGFRVEEVLYCFGCYRIRLVQCFSLLKKTKRGYQFQCKSCKVRYRDAHLEQEKIRNQAHYALNKKTIILRVGRWAQNNPGKVKANKTRYADKHTARIKARNKKWANEHPEEVKESIRNHKKTHREKIRLANKIYQQTHPLLFRAKKHRRRAKQRKAFVENVDLQIVFDRDRWVCQICYKKSE